MIYLDFNAATPVRPEIVKRVTESWGRAWANPGSASHLSGLKAQDELEKSRIKLASILSRKPSEIIFTASATEAASISIIGLTLGASKQKKDVVVARTEHSAVIEAAKVAAMLKGGKIRYLEVDRNGQILKESIDDQLTHEVAVCAAMLVNNETGVVQDLEYVRAKCDELKIAFVSDCTQAVGRVPIPSNWEDVSYFFSGHKIGAPRGIGCLVLPRSFQHDFVSVIPGGGQERKIRGGTENVALAEGISLAVEIALARQESFNRSTENGVELFLSELTRRNVPFKLVAEKAPRVKNTVNLYFEGADGDAILENTRLVEAYTGSACNSGNPEPSHVLLAMGFSYSQASCCIRFSFGDWYKTGELQNAAEDVSNAIHRVMNLTVGGTN